MLAYRGGGGGGGGVVVVVVGKNQARRHERARRTEVGLRLTLSEGQVSGPSIFSCSRGLTSYDIAVLQEFDKEILKVRLIV